MKVFFLNPKGYTCVKDPERSTWWADVWEFTLDPHKPLTFVDEDGTHYRPDRHLYTDMGSLPKFPPFIRMIWSVWRFLGFFFHDSGYAYKGLWTWNAMRRNDPFKFTPMTRKQVDDLLYRMILADPDPGNKASAWTIWSHVRMYGWLFGWGKGDKRDSDKKGKSIDPLNGGGIIKEAP